ncbi:MAG: 16S rRNA (guanine(527)-N(7))-methyltransferase RsmG [Parvularculaceae bacterium]|nr:16S rRNA (guanine(527)-N(7))-methyltransferase RsmG [Parvularculaceae bacterium]
MTITPAGFAAEFNVSRETLARLEAFDACLLDWSARHNLIARSTLEDRWDRHFRDSAQLFALIPPEARSLADLGSGAGFPGLVLAAMGESRGLRVTLVESIGKKAAFLAAAIDAMGLANARVVPARIESLSIAKPDVITARALASLPKLLGYAHKIGDETTLCIFPKGQDVAAELTEAAKSWHMEVERRASRTNPHSAVLLIKRLRPKRPAR